MSVQGNDLVLHTRDLVGNEIPGRATIDELENYLYRPQNIRHAGRMYCYTDNRWVTDSDDNYGPAYYQWQEGGGSGADPIIEWEHMGWLIQPGTKIRGITISSRASSTETTDFEIMGVLRKPDPATRWQTGFDADGEDIATELFRGLYISGGDDTLTAPNLNDRTKQQWTFDVEADELSILSLYFKPVGTITATRYNRIMYDWDLLVPTGRT